MHPECHIMLFRYKKAALVCNLTVWFESSARLESRETARHVCKSAFMFDDVARTGTTYCSERCGYPTIWSHMNSLAFFIESINPQLTIRAFSGNLDSLV